MKPRRRYTKAALCGKLALSKTALHQHLSRPGAPQPDSQGLFDLPEVRRFIRDRRTLDNRGGPAELLASRIAKLQLEADMLRHRLKTDVDTLAADDVALTLENGVNALHIELIGGLNGCVVALAREQRPPEVVRILHRALREAERRWQSWMKDQTGLHVGDAVITWPADIPCLPTLRPAE